MVVLLVVVVAVGGCGDCCDGFCGGGDGECW